MIGHVGHARFGFTAIGDVFVGLDEILRLAVLVENRDAPRQEQPQSVFRLNRVLFGDDALLADGVLVALEDEFRVGRVVDVLELAADHVFAADAQRCLGAAVGENILTVAEPLDDECNRNVVDDQFQELLGALNFARERPPLGDVLEQ